MSQLSLRDFRDERYVRLIRAWTIFFVLGQNVKFAKGVTLSKAAFVDFLLCNPAAQQKFHEHFGRSQTSLNIEDFLYKDNVEFGGLQDISAFSTSCVILINDGHLKFEKVDGEIVLKCNATIDFRHSDLIDQWIAEIKLTLPLLAKSINVLHKSILSI